MIRRIKRPEYVQPCATTSFRTTDCEPAHVAGLLPNGFTMLTPPPCRIHTENSFLFHMVDFCVDTNNMQRMCVPMHLHRGHAWPQFWTLDRIFASFGEIIMSTHPTSCRAPKSYVLRLYANIYYNVVPRHALYAGTSSVDRLVPFCHPLLFLVSLELDTYA